MLCHSKSTEYLSEICKNISNSSILSKLRNSSLKWALYKPKIRKQIKSAILNQSGGSRLLFTFQHVHLSTLSLWMNSDPDVWPFKWKLLRAVLSCDIVCYAVQGGSNFWVCGWNPQVRLFKLKLMSSTFLGTVFYAVQGLTGLNPNIWPFKWKLN